VLGNRINSGRTVWARALVGLCGLAAIWFGLDTSSHARRHNYFILRAPPSVELRPHVLFVLDTSGSMGWRAQTDPTECLWNECEVSGPGESRISAARRVIQQVVQGTEAQATFALMSFEQNDPPTAPPPRCAGGNRFTWITHFGYFDWIEIEKYPDVQGSWRLCQGDAQQPWPYLRWDELGVGAPDLEQTETGAVPPSPLLGTDPGEAEDPANATRRVQWFPEFLGIRVHLDDTTDPDGEILAATFGDYGNTTPERNAQVRDHDFYYWPYVDGFPHYSDTSTFPFNTGLNRGGVIGQRDTISEAKLYAPFYLDLRDTTIPDENWGPESPVESRNEIVARTNPLIDGGLDVSGNTPWASAIGAIPDVPIESNDSTAHNSVASYLSFVNSLDSSDFCAPISVIMVSDGVPSPEEGEAELYQRLADLRRRLGVRTYAVGFFSDGDSQINEMACAAAGACAGACQNPCQDPSARNFDTCFDPANPATSCAYQATSATQLASVLTEIVQAEVDVELPSGPAYTVNEFSVASDPNGTGTPTTPAPVQTTVTAWTEFPGFEGHVAREYCRHRDEGGALRPICVPPAPEFQIAEQEATFGPCPQSRQWDAGACLQSTAWFDRRIYSANAAGAIYAIADGDGDATSQFATELQNLGILRGADPDEVVAFIQGRDWPDGWKLPGLANSAPIVVRRIPPYQRESRPSVSIRDPHCAGRGYPQNEDVPASLIDFSEGVWAEDTGILATPSEHYEYQEAVLVGDDLGMLHAFQFNSGNELWGFIPREALANSMRQFVIGAATRGQPDAIDEHLFGIASTVNVGWVFDPDAASAIPTPRWRHLGVFGMGEGGRNYYALDLSHMSPTSPRGPFEVLWTTRTAATDFFEDEWIGETWARPALTYNVPDDAIGEEPNAFLVLGSGYPQTDADQGRRLFRIDAVTGAVIEHVELPVPPDGTTFQPRLHYGATIDPSVASNCRSGFWAEAQETYIADPAGRLFRWDLGFDAEHASDSHPDPLPPGDTRWSQNRTGAGGSPVARPLFTAPACVGPLTGCTVPPSVTSGSFGDPFVFAPAVTVNDRIDDAIGGNPTSIDQYLIALISGGFDEASLDLNGNFHSSMYLLVDDHTAPGNQSGGLTLPAGMPTMTPAEVGSNARYMRIAVSALTRERIVVPFPGADPLPPERRNFSRSTRPTRSPEIRVTGVVNTAGDEAVPVEDNEVYDIRFWVYEPPSATCDARFFDPDTRTWYPDRGDTYEILFRFTASSTSGFNFATGSTDTGVDFEDSGVRRGLQLVGVEQVTTGDCVGNCGADSAGQSFAACDNNQPPAADGPPQPTRGSLALSSRAVTGFTPQQ